MTTPYAPKQASARGRTVRLDGLDMYVEECGGGEPLVLLHGFGGCAQTWHPFTADLSQRHRLIVPDLRGHGYSTNPTNEFTHRQAASDVLVLLDKLGVGRFSAMGISSGGMALLHMATSQPQRIDAMVLISATSHLPEQARALMRGVSFERMPTPVQEMYRECAKRGDGQIRQLIAQFHALHENHDDMNFTVQDLSAITARTLVVHGEHDRFFPVEIALSLARSIPDAASWIVPGGDHVPIYDPGIGFVAAALRFLEGDVRQVAPS